MKTNFSSFPAVTVHCTLYSVQVHLLHMAVETEHCKPTVLRRKVMYLRICTSLKYAKNWVRKCANCKNDRVRKSTNCYICVRSTNLKTMRICGTYLRTAKLVDRTLTFSCLRISSLQKTNF